MAAPKLEDDYRIVAVKEHAAANYENGGWDILIETMDDQEIYNIIYKARSSKGAIKLMAAHVGALAAYRDEIVNA